jgi:hypothetical protein
MCYSVYRDVGCKQGVRLWSVFMWRRIGHTGGLFMKIVVLRNLRVPQRRGIIGWASSYYLLMID